MIPNDSLKTYAPALDMAPPEQMIYTKLEETLNRWVSQYSDAIYQMCCSMLHDRTQAEDAMQDTLVKAWRYIAKEGNPDVLYEKTWLLRIAANTCKDYLRSGWNRFILHGVMLEDLPVRLLRVKPEEQSVRLMVTELSQPYKQAVLMHYFQGMTQQEMAETLGISKTMVHRRLHKAVAMLRKEI